MECDASCTDAADRQMFFSDASRAINVAKHRSLYRQRAQTCRAGQVARVSRTKLGLRYCA